MDLLDGMHCFLVHAYDLGMRVDKYYVNNNLGHTMYDPYFDEEFFKTANAVMKQMECMKDVNVPNGSFGGKKFVININTDFFYDELCQLLNENGMGYVAEMLYEEQYHSDAIQHK